MASLSGKLSITTHNARVTKYDKEKTLFLKGFCEHNNRVECKNWVGQWTKHKECLKCLLEIRKAKQELEIYKSEQELQKITTTHDALKKEIEEANGKTKILKEELDAANNQIKIIEARVEEKEREKGGLIEDIYLLLMKFKTREAQRQRCHHCGVTALVASCTACGGKQKDLWGLDETEHRWFAKKVREVGP
jgi:SMC interacting uncharacterized protein involved in chromosome segregation